MILFVPHLQQFRGQPRLLEKHCFTLYLFNRMCLSFFRNVLESGIIFSFYPLRKNTFFMKFNSVFSEIKTAKMWKGWVTIQAIKFGKYVSGYSSI
jgi:hypothetical protein